LAVPAACQHCAVRMRDSEVQRWMNPSRERAAMFWPKLNAFLLECWMCRNLNMALAR